MKLKLPECVAAEELKAACISALCKMEYEPVGRWFEACLKRQHSEHSVSIAGEDAKEEEEDGAGVDEVLTEDDKIFIIGLDPKDWRRQDHYRILGLGHLRHTANDDDIKQAYRKKVLKYHPDKKSSLDHNIPGLNLAEFFTCINYAYEALNTFEGRRLFDSVDESFDDAIPTLNDASKNDFYETFEDVFKRNSGWSKIQPVNQLGNKKTPFEDVQAFYDFWYNDFSSWRDFKYLDEEDTDRAENREERRWMEKQNKSKRNKRKKDEIARLRSLVDLAYQFDPRLKAHAEQEKSKKAEEKRLKEELKKKEEQDRAEAARKTKEESERLEQETKERSAKEKKEKEKQKKAIAKERKRVRDFVKENGYFASDEDEVARVNRLDKCLENITIDLIQKLKGLAIADTKDEFQTTYLDLSSEVLQDIQRKKEEQEKEAAAVLAAKKAASNVNAAKDQNWNDLEIQMLVKATTLFPVGTQNRWETIADYINEHADADGLGKRRKTGKHVISKVKKLQKLDTSQRDEVNKRAFQVVMESTNAKLNKVPEITDISMKDHVNSDLLDNNNTTKPAAPPAAKDAAPAAAPAAPVTTPVEKPGWTPAEQKLLEEALKKFGSSEPERWEKIAGHVTTRTKKECMKRYKELVDKIKAKKSAAKQATS